MMEKSIKITVGMLATVLLLSAGNGRAQAGNYSITDLGTLGGSLSEASGINNSGKVVGYTSTAWNADHSFLYSGGTMQDLDTLGGTNSYSHGINNRGQVVGDAQTAGNAAWHAFL